MEDIGQEKEKRACRESAQWGSRGANSENGYEPQPKHFCINIINRWCW